MALKDLTSDLSKYRPADAYLKATTKVKRGHDIDRSGYTPKEMQVPTQQNSLVSKDSIHTKDNSKLNPVGTAQRVDISKSKLTNQAATNIVRFETPENKATQAAVISRLDTTDEKTGASINKEQQTSNITAALPTINTVLEEVKKTSPVKIDISSKLSGRHTTGIEVKPLPLTPNKTSVELQPLPKTPNKTSVELQPLPSTPEKAGRDTKPLPETPEKLGRDTKPLPATPEKSSVELKPLADTPTKSGMEVDSSKYSITLGETGGYTSLLKAGNFKIDSSKYTITNKSLFYPTSYRDSGFDNVSVSPPYSPAGYESLNSLYDLESPITYDVTLETSSYLGRETALYSVRENKIGSQLAHSVGSALIKTSGYTTTEPYGIAAGARGLLGPRYMVSNSPSILDNLYSKNPLTLAAWNPTYALQPFIVRGIGQLWGNPNAGFDGGFIRGGAKTVANRTAADTLRITRWMASPKGLLWMIRQQGLQLTNPMVETADPTGFYRSTRVFNPLATLANIVGKPLGVHLTRHGLIPPEVSLNRYEEVVKTRAGLTNLSGSSVQNRLVKLYQELEPINAIADALQPKNKVKSKLGDFLKVAALKLASVFHSDRLPFITLTGVAGPKSLYGLGITAHSRWVNSYPQDASSYYFYNVRSQYASTLALTTNPFGSSMDDRATFDTDQIDATGLRKRVKVKSTSLEKGHPYHPEFNALGQSPGSAKSTELQESPYHKTIQDYITLPYSKLGTSGEGDLIAERFTSFQDFRNALKHGKYSGKSIDAGTTLGKQGTLDYSETNPNKTFGMIDTSPGLDKTDYTTKQNRGDKINSIDYKKSNYKDIYVVDGIEYRDYIQFFFSGPSLGDLNEQTEDVIPFRAILGGISDSHNPQWNEQQMLGRADSAYLYQGYSRALNFTFKVAANSREEMKPMWRKINYLASWTTPKYLESGLMKAPFCRLTLGNLFQETPGFISSLNIDIDTDTPWEINLEDDETMMQLPLKAEITVGFTVVHDYRPQWGGRMFSLSERGGNTPTTDTGQNWLWDSLRG